METCSENIFHCIYFSHLLTFSYIRQLHKILTRYQPSREDGVSAIRNGSSLATGMAYYGALQPPPVEYFISLTIISVGCWVTLYDTIHREIRFNLQKCLLSPVSTKWDLAWKYSTLKYQFFFHQSIENKWGILLEVKNPKNPPPLFFTQNRLWAVHNFL